MADPIFMDLKQYVLKQGIVLKDGRAILDEAIERIRGKYGYSKKEMKTNFDDLILETEEVAYEIYKKEEREYGTKFMNAFVHYLREIGEIKKLDDMGPAFARHFGVIDRFYLSLSQSRRSRAGKSFEVIHNSLFKILGYPFDEQKTIEGKPDFVMPSVAYYKQNPLQSIVFTAKRTLRERWRQIVTEGTRGIGFFLATIDPGMSANMLKEMSGHKIFVVCPKSIKTLKYPDAVNVISFERFFEDHLDPKMKIWKRDNAIIQ